MKKFFTMILALALVLSLSVPAFAANETNGQTDLTFTYGNTPTYTVTIPASLTLAVGDNDLPITASDVADLNGKTITVTFEGTMPNDKDAVDDRYYTRLWLNGSNVGGNAIRYDLYDADGQYVSTFGTCAAGTVLASFTTSGIQNIRIYIDPFYVTTSGFQPGAPYTNYITFGIALV